jgi:hypothetical protein
MVRSLRIGSGDNLVTLFPGHRSRPSGSLAGLTIEETNEFLALDEMNPVDDNGSIAWTFEGGPTSGRERRWLELYQKHQRARSDADGDRG